MQDDQKKLKIKEFIKMRKKQMKNLKADDKEVSNLRELIAPGTVSKFKQAILSQNYETVYNFLLSEDEVRTTPLAYILKEEQWLSYLEAVVGWSTNIIPSPLLKKVQEMKENEFKLNMMRTKFLNFNRHLIDKVLSLESGSEELQKLISILTEKSSLFEMMFSQFTNLQNLILVVPEKKKFYLLDNFYCPLSQKLENQQRRKQIESELKFIKREEVWQTEKFVENISEGNNLMLQQLNYNFLHQLASQNKVEELIAALDEIEESLQKNQDIQNMFSTFDTVNETPFDIILRSWTYENILKFLESASGKQCIILSMNCLTKILKNKKLSQANVEEFINNFLKGEISEKGYLERTLKENKKKSSFKNWTSSYIITFDKKKVLMAKQEGSYPLILYLAKYCGKSDLKTVSVLMFKDLEKKQIKKKVITLIELFGRMQKKIDEKNEGAKEVENIEYYYQQLLKEICRLPHGQLLQFFLTKLYLNFFEVSIHGPHLNIVNRHFICNYVAMNSDLSENELNKKIYDAIINCKESEKQIKKFNLFIELLRQYKQNSTLNKSQEWLPVQIKNYLIEYFKNLPPQLYLTEYILNKNSSLQILGKSLELFYPKEDIYNHIMKSEIPYLAYSLEDPKLREKYGDLIQDSEEMKDDHIKFEYKRKRGGYVFMIQQFNEPEQELTFPELQKNYKLNKSYDNFCAYLKLYSKKQYALDIAQERLGDKAIILLEKNIEINFKMIRKQVPGSEMLNYSNFADATQQPFKTIFKNMSRLRSKVKSQTFKNSVYLCEDANVDTHLQVLKKFHIYSQRKQFRQKEINIFLEGRILDDLDLLQKLQFWEQGQVTQKNRIDLLYDFVKRILNEMCFGVRSIKGDKESVHHKRVMKLISLFIQKYTQYSKLVPDHSSFTQFYVFASLHDRSKCDLSEFFRQIPSHIMGPYHSSLLSVWVIGSKENPLQFYLQCKEDFKKRLPLWLQNKEKEHEQILENTHQNEKKRVISSYQKQVQDLKKRQNLLSVMFLFICQFFKNIDSETAYLFDEIKPIFPTELIDLPDAQKESQMYISKLLQVLTKEHSSMKVFNLMLEKQLLVDVRKCKMYMKKKCFLLNAAVYAFLDFNVKCVIQIPKSAPVEGYEYVNKCNDECYDKFLQYFNRMINYRIIDDVKKQGKINQVVTALFKEQKWDRLLKLIKTVKCGKQENTKYFLNSLFNICGCNLERVNRYPEPQKYNEVLDGMFDNLKDNLKQFDENIFKYAFLIDSDRAIQIMKPKQLSLLIYCQCLRKRPHYAPIFRKLQIKLREGGFPQNDRQTLKNNSVPLSPYSHTDFKTCPYLIDLMILQMMVIKEWANGVEEHKIFNYMNTFDKKKQSVFMVREVMDNHEQIYTQEQVKQYSAQVFNTLTLKTIKEIPKAYLTAYFTHHKKLKNIYNQQSQNIILQVLEQGYLNFDYMVDVIKSCRMNVFEQFIEKNSITMDLQTKNKIQSQQLKKKTLIQLLMEFSNQKYATQFIEKYKILQLYEDNFKQTSGKILRTIAALQQTQMLTYIINKFKQIGGGNLNYAEVENDQQAHYDKESQTMFLPTNLASLNNFYEYHFLLKEQQKQSNKFKSSTRFLLECNPEKYGFIGEMKRRLQLLKVFSENLAKGRQMNFHLSVLVPGILQVQKKEKGKEEYTGFWMESLISLINYSVKKEMHIDTDCSALYSQVGVKVKNIKQKGIFEILLFIVSHPSVNIPQKCFMKTDPNEIDHKVYPNEYKVLKQVLKIQQINVTGHDQGHFLLNNNPQIKDLILQYNPKYFMENYGHQLQSNFQMYIKGIFMNLHMLQNQYEQLLTNYIQKCFLFDSVDSLLVYLKQNLFKLCLLSRYEGKGIVMGMVTKHMNKGSDDQTLFTLGVQLNKRSGEYQYDPMLWTKMQSDIARTIEQKQLNGNGVGYEIFISEEQVYNSKFINAKSIIGVMVEGMKSIFGCMSGISSYCYLLSEGKAILSELQKPKQMNVSYILGENKKQVNVAEDLVNIDVAYNIIDFNRCLKRIQIDIYETVQIVNRHFYLEGAKDNDIVGLQTKCLGKLVFQVDPESFNQVQSLSTLKKMLQETSMSNDGITLIKRQLQKLQGQIKPDIEGIRYSLSDVYGPIAINNQTNKNSVLQAISFYEYCELPQAKIIIKYAQELPQNGAKAMLADIRQYFRYFKYQINSDQDQNPQPYQFNNVLFITKKAESETSLKLVLDYFHPSNIVSFIQALNYYGMELTRTFQNLVNVRFSVPSIFRIVEEKITQFNTSQDVLKFVHSFISAKRCQKMIQRMLMMVIQDATNIMKVVKGVVITFENEKDRRPEGDKKPYKLTEELSLYDIKYQITQQIFSIVLKMGDAYSKTQGLEIQETNLISRKQFLSMIFSSTQFLTDYFLDKSKLTQQCVAISTSISKLVNSTTNTLINYKSLYHFIDKFKEKVSIKEIDHFLYELKTYVLNNFEKIITNYINSREIAIHHQILLLNKFQSLKEDNRNIEDIYKAKELQYVSKGVNNQALTQVKGFSSNISQDNGINMKNIFLIQIYKSYFSSMVREGMSFILGYKSPNRQPTIIQLQKKEDVDRVNIVQLSFMLWISNRIPTNDQLNRNKIIRMFISDLNKNVYQISEEVQNKLLNLPEESEERNITEMVPIIQPNLTLTFGYEGKEHKDEENRDQKYLDMELQEKRKFQIKPRSAKTIPTINYLKRDSAFLQMIQDTLFFMKENIPHPFKLRVNPSVDGQVLQINQSLKFVLYDIESSINTIFYEPLRHPALQAYASIEQGEDLRENLILRKRKQLFCKHYESFTIVFTKQGNSNILIEGRQIKLFVSLLKEKTSINVNDIVGTILKDLISKVLKQNNKIKQLYRIQQKQDNYNKVLDSFLASEYQIKIVQQTLQIATKLTNADLPSGYEFTIKTNQKSQIRHDKQNNKMVIQIRGDVPQTQFYSSCQILSYLLNKNVQIAVNTTTTKYLPNGTIQVQNYHQIPQAQLIIVNKDGSVEKEEVKIQNADQFLNRGFIKFPSLQDHHKKYYISQIYNKEVNICSNYFYKYPQLENMVKEKKGLGFNKLKYHLLLESNQPIHLTHCPIHLQANIPEKISERKNVTKKFKDFQIQIGIKLLSQEIMLLSFQCLVTCGITVGYGKYKNVHNQSIQSSFIELASSGQIKFQNTKFVELIFRNKTHKAKSIFENEHLKKYEIFKEPPEKAELQMVQKINKDSQSLVYIVNEQAKKYLTRAGEQRTDVINFCDGSGNPIAYHQHIDIYFKHMNTHEVYQPQINQDAIRVQLKWCPIVRGPYQVFFNGIRLNPQYQIGVCAAYADVNNSKIQNPKVRKLCYSQQTECIFQLKDSYGNIYTQLQENILGDNLMIDIVAGQIQNKIKVKNNPINKYGTKKVRFSIDDPTGEQEQKVDIVVKLNLQEISAFQLQIKGQALSQRRKNLEKDIDKVCKGYYKDITISRSNFLEGLFKIAQKSLMVNLSIKFAGEQGIDAGGLKRQFYDMIGNQIKSQRNPFFKATDSQKIQYFINPDILKNKKKKQYMNLFGKYLANSLSNSYLIGVSFSPVFIKLLYEDPVEFDDLLSIVSKEQADRYNYLLSAGDQVQNLQLYFTVITDKKKGIQVELKDDGKEILVTKDNLDQYLRLLTKALIQDRFKEEIESFREGFNTVFSLDIVRKWIRPSQFWAITAGTKEITPQIVLNYTVFSGGQDMHNSWFRRYIQQSNLQVLLGFLKFSSGSSSIDFYQTSKITVRFEKSGANPKKLPISHTCWKQIIVPTYKTYDIMKQLLNAAFIFCSQGFGFG